MQHLTSVLVNVHIYKLPDASIFECDMLMHLTSTEESVSLFFSSFCASAATHLIFAPPDRPHEAIVVLNDDREVGDEISTVFSNIAGDDSVFFWHDKISLSQQVHARKGRVKMRWIVRALKGKRGMYTGQNTLKMVPVVVMKESNIIVSFSSRKPASSEVAAIDDLTLKLKAAM